MSNALRREYLAALGLETWVLRGKSSLPGETARDAVALRETPAAREAGVDWPELRARVAACTRCALCNTRTQTVFAWAAKRQTGSSSAKRRVPRGPPG